MGIDLPQLKADEIKILKKAALGLLLDEIAEVIPLAVAEVNSLLPAEVLAFAQGVEAQYIPSLQAALIKVLQEKLG